MVWSLARFEEVVACLFFLVILSTGWISGLVVFGKGLGSSVIGSCGKMVKGAGVDKGSTGGWGGSVGKGVTSTGGREGSG